MDITVYRSILEAVSANPTAQVTRLCKEKGVSYQAFNSWRRRQVPRGTVLHVSLEELAGLYLAGKAHITFEVHEVVRKLAKQDRDAFAMYVGLLRIESDFDEARLKHDGQPKSNA